MTVLILKIKIIGGCRVFIETCFFYPNQRFLIFQYELKLSQSLLKNENVLIRYARVQVFIADYFFTSNLAENYAYADLEVKYSGLVSGI